MGKKGGGDGWGPWALLGVVVGAVALHYAQTGRGDENNAPLIPDSLEGKIDRVVEELNRRFGKRWVGAGLDAVMAHLQRTLPPPVVVVANVIFQVEQMSRYVRMTNLGKRQTAIRRLRAG
jgi:hypothetical protein